MRKRAWIHQRKEQVEKFGEDAPWYVGWRDPAGKVCSKSCGPGKKGKKAAETLADKRHAELVTGTYQSQERKKWADFRKRYDERVLTAMPERTRDTTRRALNNFERLAKPGRMLSVTAEMIADYVAKRRAEKAKTKPLSPATINLELRVLRSALRIARDWKMIQSVPAIRFLKQMEKTPTFCPPEHFAAIYTACEGATYPDDIPNVTPAEWWQGLLTVAYCTGWRISQILALRWADVDLDAGIALSQAEDNKGRRDTRLPLHPVVVEHLRKLAGSFAALVFPWNRNRRELWNVFAEIQEQAVMVTVDAEGRKVEKPLPKGGKGGRRYGFHDMRRGFATMNADALDLLTLQALMQHKSLDTTRLYVNMAGKLKQTAKAIFVPPVLERSEAAV